jgi:hypothetical protein
MICTSHHNSIQVIKLRGMRCVGSCGTCGVKERRLVGFGGETWKSRLLRPRYEWEDSIKVDIQ